MKKLHCLIFLLLLLSRAHAQTDIEHDNRLHPLLKQAINKTPGLVVYGRYNKSKHEKKTELNTTSHTLSWFTCHGRFFDSARLTGEEYRAITTKAIDPFTLYQDMCSEELAIVKAAKNIYRVYGLKRALQSTNMNYRAVFASQEVQKAKTPLEKLMAIDNIQKGFLLQQAYINCPAPFQLQNSPALSTANSQPGKMLQTKDSTVYYNIDPLASTNKIILYKQAPGKLYVFNRQSQLTDSVWLQPGKYSLLLKEKTDVFLLYRGWLEMQLQEATDNVMQLIKNNTTEDSATLYRYAFKQDDVAVSQTLHTLYRRINAIETKIEAAISPETAAIEQYVYNQYRNEPSEILYAAGMGVGYTFTEVRGRKVYELTNHLGNVLATVSDRRKAISTNNSTVDHYEPVVINATDYYAFGMEMPGRVYNGGTYRYGFNGKENDNEVKGEGNQQDYGMRIYDPRLGRFLSTDPLTDKYPELTPYQFASNRPIDGIDENGLEWAPPMRTGPDGKLTVDVNTAAKLHLALGEKLKAYTNRSTEAAQRSIMIYEISTKEKASLWFKAKTYFASFFSWNAGGDYTDADDISVLTYGKHASGDKAGTIDVSLATVGMVLPFISGGSIKKMFKGVTSGIGRESFEKIMTKVDNIAKALDETHITAAVNDIAGKPVIVNGKVYNHLQEVEDALSGLGNQISKLNKEINDGVYSGKVLEAAQKARSELQIKKDNISAVLDRARKKVETK